MTANDHNHAEDVRTASRNGLLIAILLTVGFMAAEVVAGIVADSLALLADAGHMVTDAASIGLALVALWVASLPASRSHSYGFQRAEVIASLLNAVSLWLIAGWTFYEASRRFTDTPDARGSIMLSAGTAGLLANLGAAWVLRRTAGGSLNVQAAFLHVLSDLLGSVAVVVGGVLILTLGWSVVDPVFSVVIGVLILASSGRLLLKVLRVLMQGTPPHVDIMAVCGRLERMENVTGVHDVHVWSLTSGYDILSAHVTTRPGSPDQIASTLRHLRDIVKREFGIAHVTIQVEASAEECLERHHVPHS